MKDKWQALNEDMSLKQKNRKGIGKIIHQCFIKVGGFDFEQPKRSVVRKTPDFSESS